MARTWSLAAAFSLALTVALPAQQPRDTAVPAAAASPIGTGAIAGLVTTGGDADEPLRMALVAVRSTDQPRIYQTATDADGRFLVEGLPAGRYLVSATKRGYLPASFGAESWSAPGVPLVLAEGQRATIGIALPKGAVISGFVTRCAGYGVNGGTINAVRIETVNGLSRFVRAGISGGYDERGFYRIWGLPPGDYYIQAGPTITNSVDLIQTTDAVLDWARRVVERPAAPGAPPDPVPSSANIAYPQCYYPGTSDEAQAVAITVGLGEERTGVNYPGTTVNAATVRGRMYDPGGAAPVGVRAALIRPRSLVDRATPVVVRPSADGTFSLSRVPPGDYVLVVRAAVEGETPEAVVSGPAGPIFFSPTLPLWATVGLSVNGVDVDNVVVQLQRGMTVSGRIALSTRGTAAPPDFSAMRVNLIPAAGNLSEALTAPPAVVNPDGTFEITGVPPNRYRLVVAMSPADGQAWTLHGTSMNGRDSADVPVEILAGQDVTDAVVTLTDSPTALTGRLLDATGQPVSGYTLLAFSTNPEYWLAQSRRVALVRSATDGTYAFTGLPAGEYYLCAASEIEEGRIDDASLLETLTGMAVRVTIAEGDDQQLDFTLGG